MLLPLVPGNSVNGSDCSEGVQHRSSRAVPASLDSRDTSTDGLVTGVSDDNELINGYPFISDVNSLAWGVCGDSYNRHKESVFREFLFVSGDRGVTVHAFRHPHESCATAKATEESDIGHGSWVEWGPSLSNYCSDTPEGDADVNTTDSGESVQSSSEEAGNNCIIPKRWLRTFLTSAETVESEGNVFTKFPGKRSFPCSAKVVSFSIFGRNSSPVDVSCGTSYSGSSVESAPDALGNFLSTGEQSSYRCSRLFSSKSQELVGFVFNFEEPGFVSTFIEGKILLLIARLDILGLHWASSVKLSNSVDKGTKVEWSDFQFSDSLLACLTTSGLIFLYGVKTGEYVARLDILKIFGLNTLSNSSEQEKFSVEGDQAYESIDKQIKEGDAVYDRLTHKAQYLRGKKGFRRLIAASYNSFLAAIDEHGVAYIICIGDYLPDKFYSIEKLLPHFQRLGQGMLVGWKVGGSKISLQRVFSQISDPHRPSQPSFTKGNFFSMFDNGSISNMGIQERESYAKVALRDLHTCDSPLMSPSHVMRKIFLPPDGSSEDDFICFSPFGVTRLTKKHNIKVTRSFHIVHSNMDVGLTVHDDNFTCKANNILGTERVLDGEVVCCAFGGNFYLVTNYGLSVVLPSVAVSSDFLPIEFLGYRQPSISKGIEHLVGNIFTNKQSIQSLSPWKLEVMDRILVYEGPEVADHICSENGWDMKISRMRRLQLALDFLKFEEIQKSLEMLVSINLAEEGILRLLFVAVYLIFHRVGNDSESIAASRLLKLGMQFATKMIRRYGVVKHRKDTVTIEGTWGTPVGSSPTVVPGKGQNETEDSSKLREMAHYLEIIREVQCRLNSKFRRRGHGLGNGEEAVNGMDNDLLPDDSQLLSLPVNANAALSDELNQGLVFPSVSDVHNAVKLALMPLTPLDSESHMDSDAHSGICALVPDGEVVTKKVLPFENPKDMIARWEIGNLDIKTVVKDALLSGRLPLAVLQLHLHRLKDLISDREPHDTFTEVHDVGRAIAYELFLKGETGLAVATLQRLGEDVETSLKQLVFGTVRRSLRVQVARELTRYGYLGSHESKILERISFIERFYPCSSFWRTFFGRQKEVMGVSSSLNSPREYNLHLLHSHLFNSLTIDCGEIDGVVLGSWANANDDNIGFHDIDEDSIHGGYWAAAAIWSDAWDQRTTDRIVLDQPFLVAAHVSWESQLEYYIYHNNWDEVFKLLNTIPSYLLSDGTLQISLDSLQSVSNVGYGRVSPVYGSYIFSPEELDTVSMDVQGVKFFKFPAVKMCSMWLKTLIEQELAKKFIFLKEYWGRIAEFLPVLSHSGFITHGYKISDEDEHTKGASDIGSSTISKTAHSDITQAFHRLVVHHCALYKLPNFLDLYLDHHSLVSDNDSLSSLQEAAGDCQWAKWLLLSRAKGREYDASFSNAHSIMSYNLVPGSNINVPEIDDIIQTIDDIAEGGGEMTALATLMFAPVPIQNCLSTGSVNRLRNSSAQCTMENLSPTLQRYPTLWRALVSACLGQDASYNFLAPVVKNVCGNSPLSEYLNWRANIFSSTGCDTSLSLMLPCWFSRAVRRLIQLYVEGPLGWQSLVGLPTPEAFLHRELEFFFNSDEHIEINAISWEAAIKKHIEEELYASSLKETGLGLEPHLHRGRALAAFNHLLGVRLAKFKSERICEGKSGSSVHGQTNVQSDVQTLLAQITESEEFLVSSVKPLGIMHFEDSVLVASCTFFLELCGLSASMFRVDIAALKRISSFHKLSDSDHYRQLSPRGSAFHSLPHERDITYSLARALADDYLHHDRASLTKRNGTTNSYTSEQPSRALMLVLQHLERASLPLMFDGKTCGSWLCSGNGDGTELRSQQKTGSQHWNLVTVFCQMHQISLSTKYLAVLARDNDWVGFLSESQAGGYSLESVIEVASKEFSDPRLKIHILTVLKGIQLRKKPTSSSNSDTKEKRSDVPSSDEIMYSPVELFGILAESEKQKNPGEALLIKAKDLSWSILAMLASCFPDVSPLSCLTVWLEITAARETSSIKVNDIASQIAVNVGAAVEATKSIPVASRALTFHYNRRNPKRRRLMEVMSVDPLVATESDASISSAGASMSFPQGLSVESEIKKESSQCDQVSGDSDDGRGPDSLSKMVAVLCYQHLFLPLLRAFEMFLPSCSLLPFIRALQAFSQMRLSEASAHLGSFSSRIKEESPHSQTSLGKEQQIGTSWIISTAMKAADAMLSTCPSPYEKRCLLQLLAATDFGDGGAAATYYCQLFWKINLAEPSLRKDDTLQLGSDTLDDASLLRALEKNGHWEHARNWARQLEASGGPWKSAVHHVTEVQAESMAEEWKEFLWDVPEERVALWGHCQMLFLRYSFPALQAGLFFLRHAESVEKDIPARELHELLLLSLQWLSGMITLSNPVYPLHLLREIETRVWLLAVESEAQVKNEGDFISSSMMREPYSSNGNNIIDRTASIIAKMDNHITMKNKNIEKNGTRENSQTHAKSTNVLDSGFSVSTVGTMKKKRIAKGYVPSRRSLMDSNDKISDVEDGSNIPHSRTDLSSQDENFKVEMSVSGWEERVRPADLESAVLSLLEFGQVAASKQLQYKLSPTKLPSEFLVVNAALKLASLSTPNSKVSISVVDEEVCSVIQSCNIPVDQHLVEPLKVLGTLATILNEGSGRGLCKRIIVVVQAANILGLSFSEAYDKPPIELLQLLSLKAQDSFEEAKLLVQTHIMPSANIAQILAESFLKGLLAAHRGGYMDSQKEEGPAPLLWRFSDFLKWAELCPSEPEIGHALMRLVITGQEIPHACEVELLILSHHFYKSSACLDGVDVLVALAATRVEAYVSEGDFACLARLITGVGNFHALNFILGILIENGQLDLLLQKFSAAADTNTGTAEAVRFRMAVLTSLKHYNPNDLDSFAMVYNHFDLKHETASLLESRAEHCSQSWFLRYDKDQNEDLLESMSFYIEAAEVHSSIDAGNKTRRACAMASLVSLQIRMPDFQWLSLSETNARRALVEQSRFQEAMIVAEAYNLNWASEWALVLWNQMLKPELTEKFVAEFVAVLPLQPSMLVDLSKFYRAEVAARGDQSQFSVWLTGGGLPAEWAKYLGRSFRCLLKRTRDLRLRLQLASVATGFNDVIDACTKALDKVPDTAGPLVLRKGHGGAYLPLM